MGRVAGIVVACVALAAASEAVRAGECPGQPDALGVSRIIEVDTANGPRFGTWQYPSTLDLAPGEVVLTFDDGPHPKNTERILEALDEHCAKATFFKVGVWVRHLPHVVRKVAARGHTVGNHTWSHPSRLSRLSLEQATEQIERGFAALEAALGHAPAPFFRYPGLNDSETLNAYAATQGYGIFSCDIATDDWLGISAASIVARTMARLKRHGRGIIILHDSKATTAAAMPALLAELKAEGYKLVHIVPQPARSHKDALAQDKGEATEGGQQALP